MVQTIEQLPGHPLVADYLLGKPAVCALFEYAPNETEADEQRLSYIKKQAYQRTALHNVLTKFNRKYTDNEAVFQNIDKIQNEDSVVVVGGQQAGLLTGPAYTIHKCLSIIKMAQEKEKKLGIPVIPVFWIAGEDHDVDEINHVHTEQNSRMEKRVFMNMPNNKRPVSEIPIDSSMLKTWVEEVFQSYGESTHTEELVDEIENMAEKSKTFVDFFAFLIHRIFHLYGLVLLDSCSPDIRQLETEYFSRMIKQSDAINQGVIQQLNRINTLGYQVNLDQTFGDANLFFHEQGDRKLLEKRDGSYLAKDRIVRQDEEALLKLAYEEPERLSNNVVTRPLMQEMLLPTLAFIGGPGEIAYWSTLKTAFQELSLEMPPVLPRVRLTLIERSLSRWLEDMQMNLETILEDGLQEQKQRWLDNQQEYDIEEVVADVRQAVQEAYSPLRQLATDIDSGLIDLAEKNKAFIDGQITFLKKKIKASTEAKHWTELKKFDRAQLELLPEGQPQERIWSIFYFINQYGTDFIDRLMEEEYSFKGYSHVFYI